MIAGEDADYEKAMNVCERMLAFEMDDLQRSNIQRKMGDTCLEIFRHDKNLETCERAIQAYKQALLVYTLERYPNPHAKVMRSLGSAYAARADQVDRIENLKRAINSWQKSLYSFPRLALPRTMHLFRMSWVRHFENWRNARMDWKTAIKQLRHAKMPSASMT